MVNTNWKINKISVDYFKKILLLKFNYKLKGKNKIIFKKYNKIIKIFLFKNIFIYKGYFYRKLNITKFILNFKYGDFIFTRKPYKYILKLKK